MLARSRLLGRFCGLQRDEGVSKLPQTFVSLYREVILDFFAAPSTKRISGRDKLGFNGTFKIITDGKFAVEIFFQLDQFFRLIEYFSSDFMRKTVPLYSSMASVDVTVSRQLPRTLSKFA